MSALMTSRVHRMLALMTSCVSFCTHPHPSQGVFIFGNAMEAQEHLQSLVYARLVALNNPVFDFTGCNYTEKNMSKADKVGVSQVWL